MLLALLMGLLQYAVKVIDKKEVDETWLQMEVKILKKVKHPNIMRCQ
jgi:hypothetical protein